MDLELKNKVIIVTGGAKGIGEGIVRVLASEGAIPVIVGRSEADNGPSEEGAGRGQRGRAEEAEGETEEGRVRR